jgi:hypothetical protein
VGRMKSENDELRQALQTSNGHLKEAQKQLESNSQGEAPW